MRLLYPCDPLLQKEPDEAYAEEFNAARAAGIACSLFSMEDFEQGGFEPRPSFAVGQEILYRGWMLTPEHYARLQSVIEDQGGKAVTAQGQYRLCHHLPQWYPLCSDMTPRTCFLDRDADFVSAVSQLGWRAYFVKDYVKSLTTSQGSVAKRPEDIEGVVRDIEKYRGQIEGGVCIREFEVLCPDTEERYFVFRRKVFSREGVVPDMVERIASIIDSPFFSVDMVLTPSGTPRLIELGDGQVSDRKKWSADRFVEIFRD